ncbi:hypothetical protein PPERSA_02099 [Pseudocohnilembus persalinus]|uniref:Uncharacterized protein n=1 Tax=Pseudocohnilembus persalinus TaxID=266149 RepID=A0A0V0Q7V3_PSEPJ|nr:hypothetical protein PPERSA_02099 [Pseudocohnilembus persalinus]|eukprot:KRW98322.1 hypothetical protein PPERSA_02099 [Pseudocohnilembus persalinus]
MDIKENKESQDKGNIPNREKYDPNKKYPKFPFTHKNGGVNMGYEKTPIESNFIAGIIKQIGSKIVSGQIKNVMEISKPIKLCSKVSFIELASFDNCPTQYLDYAAYTQDPVERLKYIATFIISAIPYVPSKIYQKIPSDPYRGETAQLINERGTIFQAESFEYKSPSCLINITGKDNLWKLNYFHKTKANLILPKMNDIEAGNLKDKVFEFQDGSKIIAQTMLIHVQGILVGDRTMKVQKIQRIIDTKNHLQLIITYNYHRERTISKLAKSFTGFLMNKKQDVQEADSFTIEIYRYESNFKAQNLKDFEYRTELSPQEQKKEYTIRHLVSKGSGNYMSHLQFDGEVFWKSTDHYPQWTSLNQNLLESDFTLREDLMHLADGNLVFAEQIKNELEARDEKDQKIRYKD